MKQLIIKEIKELSISTDWRKKVDILIEKAHSIDIDTINWKEYPHQPKVKLYIAWASTCLYLLFDVRKDYPRAIHTDSNSKVCEDSCVEFFIQHPDEPVYRNFEFNCLGTCLSAKRKSRTDFSYLSEKEINKILVHTTLTKEGIHPETLSDWQLLAEIPFELLDIRGEIKNKKIYANCYKCGDQTKIPHFLSWNPIKTQQPDFHRPEYFGEMIFEIA